VANYHCYRLRVTALTPLHIGSGRDLLNGYDYAIHNGRTWRINEDALLDAQDVDDLALAERLAQTPPAQLLQSPDDYRADAPFFRYVIKGTPRSKARGAQVREQLKDVYDRPYLPGTSLKGALRTALAWVLWSKKQLRPDSTNLNRRRQFAARWYEQELFSQHGGKAPNHDLLRALQVTDSAPLSPDQLMLVNVRVLNRGGGLGSPIESEAVRPDAVFELTLKIDEALFSDWAKEGGLRLRGAGLLRNLPKVVQAYTGQRLEHEAAWYGEIPGAERLAGFYKQFSALSLPPKACLLQLGWGTGWEGKTFGTHLQADSRFMEGILRSPREGGYGLARGKRRSGDPFPKSRRVLVKVQRSQDGRTLEMPVSPLGWVLVEFQ